MPDPTRHVGALLRRERLAAGYDLRDLALYAGVTPQTVEQYDREPRPPLGTVILLLTRCGASPRIIHSVRRIYAREGLAAVSPHHKKNPAGSHPAGHRDSE
jgi:transcriptional regulator with XRE-family HTH domain